MMSNTLPAGQKGYEIVSHWECYLSQCFNIKSCWLLDVDECEDPDNECTQLCNNYIGGYRCFCRPGYILDPDKHTCQGNEWFWSNEILRHFYSGCQFNILIYNWLCKNECQSASHYCKINYFYSPVDYFAI